jgi:hypothetical protein
LVWIPIIHSPADLGSVGGTVRQLHVREGGEVQWDAHVGAIEAFWRTVREEIENLHLDYRRVRLYQDALPNWGREEDIIRDLASMGSPNYRLLLDLMEKGAALTGTECPELLIEEYCLARQILGSLHGSEHGHRAERHKELSDAVLLRRDRYIAQQVAATLRTGETGLIFLGGLHSLDGLLPADMEVTRLTCGSLRGRQTENGPAAQ